MCEICGKIIEHDCRCPYYIPPKVTHYCSSCGDGILDGEEYIKNLDGEYRHYECFHDMRDLLEWLDLMLKLWRKNMSKEHTVRNLVPHVLNVSDK